MTARIRYWAHREDKQEARDRSYVLAHCGRGSRAYTKGPCGVTCKREVARLCAHQMNPRKTAVMYTTFACGV